MYFRLWVLFGAALFGFGLFMQYRQELASAPTRFWVILGVAGVIAALGALAAAIWKYSERGQGKERGTSTGQGATPGTVPVAHAATPRLSQVVDRLKPALLHIESSTGSGSGFIVTADGLAVTNAHVVGDDFEVLARVPVVGGYRKHSAYVLNTDEDADIAILGVSGDGPFADMQLGDSTSVYDGDDVIALGFPLGDALGRSPTITRGIISSRRHERGVEQLQTDAAINPGNSGGPLVTADGKVIGMNTSSVDFSSSGKPVDGIGFAVAANELRHRINALSNQ